MPGLLIPKGRVRFRGRYAIAAVIAALSLAYLAIGHSAIIVERVRQPPRRPPPIPLLRPSPVTPPEGFTTAIPTAVPDEPRIYIAPPPTKGVTPSKLLQHSPGWTVITNLYLSDGTWYIVSEDGGFDEGYWPERRMLTSTGLPGLLTNIEEREPTEKEMDVLSVEDAKLRWEERLWDVEGFSILVNDPDQFLHHYYHVAAELLFGIERVLTNFDPLPPPDGRVSAPVPDRIIFMQCTEDGFSDGPRFNQFFLRAMYPSIAAIFKPTFEHLADPVRSYHKALRFPAVLFIDRSAAHRGIYTGSTSRPPAGPWKAGGGERGTGGVGRNQFWYESARRRVGKFADVPQRVLDMGLRAMDPPLVEGEKDPPVITYINRQRTGRRLVEEDHEKLVEALTEMCDRKGWILDVVLAEELSREEQIRRAARTVVLLGVHGNGLTHQIMMPPHPHSTVIEMFYPGGFARDYEWTAGVLGKAYYGIQNDTYFKPPELTQVDYPDGFQGSNIRVHAPLVVQIIEDRLEGRAPGLGHWEGIEGVGY